jgi:hypothetical protein
VFRFHIPLIEPDGPFSGIRLSDKASRFCPRKVASSPFEANQSQRIVKILVWVVHHTWPGLTLMFTTQPPTQPISSVLIHSPIGARNGSQRKVVGPPNEFAIEHAHHLCRIEQRPTLIGGCTDVSTDSRDFLLRGTGAYIALPRDRRIASPDGVSKKLYVFVWNAVDLGFALID